MGVRCSSNEDDYSHTCHDMKTIERKVLDLEMRNAFLEGRMKFVLLFWATKMNSVQMMSLI